MNREARGIVLCTLLAVLLQGCAHPGRAVLPSHGSSQALSPELIEQVLSLDPRAVSERDVSEVLSKCPAPRIILLNGLVRVVSMESFSRFLIFMGYPEDRVRHPATGSYTYSSHRSSREMAGMIAWCYENEGMRPMVIGHSQGGMLSVKILHELAGNFSETIPVWNPRVESQEERSAIVDPFTRDELPVVGLRLGFASAIAAGKPMRVLLGQWDMVRRLREIPDTVDEFVGYHVQSDLLSGTLFGFGEGDRYHATGSAEVRNIVLPEECGHFGLPLTESLAKNRQTRDWIQRYIPSTDHPRCDQAFEEEGTRNIVFAADLWYSIKKHWVLELKRWIVAKKTGEEGL